MTIATTLLKSLNVSENFIVEVGVRMYSYMSTLGAYKMCTNHQESYLILKVLGLLWETTKDL